MITGAKGRLDGCNVDILNTSAKLKGLSDTWSARLCYSLVATNENLKLQDIARSEPGIFTLNVQSLVVQRACADNA